MPIDVALAHRRAGGLPELAGVFDASYSPAAQREWGSAGLAPRVRFAPSVSPKELRAKGSVDTIYFDDADGARQATRHLIQHGHSKIAFLGLHGSGTPHELYVWSYRREQGWRETMAESGFRTTRLCFLPESDPAGYGQEVAAATAAASALVLREDITAVVAADDHAVLGLLAALGEAKVDHARWPAIVGFDDLPEVQSYVLTSVRLPWEELGVQAAELLWRRKTARLTGPAQGYQVRMKLIPRMSSRKDWSASPAARASLDS
jgi:DNA-binding LacI/PurR family transcriptional regulator